MAAIDATHLALAIAKKLKEEQINQPFRCEAACISVKPSALNIVFFHVDFTGKHPFIGSGEIDYHEVLKQSVFAAKRANKRASVILITDGKTEFSLQGVQIVRIPARSDQMMYSRMLGYRAVARKLSGSILFLDTDVRLTRDFTALFDDSFDVGLTYRRNDTFMPFNEGMILGMAGEGLNRFFDQVLNIYDQLPGVSEIQQFYGVDPRMWRGGQLSLATLLNWPQIPEGISRVTSRGVRYQFFPCDRYNYPVKPTDRRQYLKDKWALHYKGTTKA